MLTAIFDLLSGIIAAFLGVFSGIFPWI